MNEKKQKNIFLISTSNSQNLSIRRKLYEYLESYGNIVSFVGDGLSENSFRSIDWRNSSKNNLFDTILSFFRLINIIHGNKPTHIISFAPKTNFYCHLLVRIFKYKHCAVITGLGESKKIFEKKNLLSKIIIKFLNLNYSIWITMNSNDEKILNYNNNKSNIFYNIPGEGYIMKFTNENYLNRQRKIDIIFISRIIESKGIFRFIQSVEVLKKENFNLKAVIVGELSLNKSLAKKFLFQIKNLNIPYYGYIKEDEKNKLLLDSKVLVLPSSYGEGLPFIILEAQDAGCSVVVSNNPGCIEALSLENIDLISDYNPNSIASKILIAINRFDNASDEEIIKTRNWINNSLSYLRTLDSYSSIFQRSKFL
jgi:glycosyltransferase involved in cell wall biosynthesis